MRIGRIFGIDIRLDASWLVIAGLMAFNLMAVFGHWHPQWGLLGAGLLGLAATVIFFAMLLAHELAHALVAQTLGMRVTSIRLFLLGGMSNIDHEPPSPLGELAMAIAGPIVSLGIGATCVAVSLFLVTSVDPRAPFDALQGLGPIATLVVWLGPINVGVGLFNLLPAYPLDGGRVVRALVWMITKDLDRATRIASAIGQFIGWAMIMIGATRFFVLREPMSALWLALIGWFIASGARKSYESLRAEHALEGVHVRDLMRSPGPMVPPDITVRELVERYFMPLGVQGIHVFDGDRFIGVVTPSDVWRFNRDEWHTRTAAEVMVPVRSLAFAAPDEPISEVMRRLAGGDWTQVPVMDGGALIGVLDVERVVAWLRFALRAGGVANTRIVRSM